MDTINRNRSAQSGHRPGQSTHYYAPRFVVLGLAVALIGVLALGVGCSSVQPAQEQTPKDDPVALGVVAEMALQSGDCKTASETYAKAAEASDDVKLARHATKVSLTCEHLPAALKSTARWRALVPQSRVANAMYAMVALKLYHLSDAQAAINDFSHAPLTEVVPNDLEQGDDSASEDDAAPSATTPGKPNSAQADPGGAAGKPQELTTNLTTLTAILLQRSDAVSVLTAMSGTLESASTPEALSLLSQLALKAYDAQRAERYAQQSLKRNPKDFEAKRVLARAYLMRGDAAKAIATTREVMQDDPKDSIFDLAEILTALGRFEDAHQELERLRSTQVPAVQIDSRLALLAFEVGDLKEAQRRFLELAGTGEGNEGALLTLADIAAREGDTDAAIAGYRRLYDSSVAVSARSRAAALLLARHDRKEALTLLDDYISEHPESELDLTITKAHLLADHGEPAAGIEVLNSALERHPHHPSIEYERATLLEQAGRVNDCVETLKHLLVERNGDPTMLNALGYTLADHNLELSHAEALIRRALIVMPDNPAALDSLGWVRFRKGDSKTALVTLERAYSISHDSEIAAHWGEALWVSGDHTQARKVWAEALVREPDSQQLKATLARFIPDAK